MAFEEKEEQHNRSWCSHDKDENEDENEDDDEVQEPILDNIHGNIEILRRMGRSVSGLPHIRSKSRFS